MRQLFPSLLRRSLTSLVALGVATAAQAQSPCTPTPAMPENAVTGPFEAQVRGMLAQEEDFTGLKCELTTPRFQRVARLLKPIAAAARDIGASTRFLVVHKDEENAWAKGWPDQGYHLVTVYTGIIEALDRRAAQSAQRQGRSAAELGDIFLSTVMAHEVSHLILRHSQDTNCRQRSSLNAGSSLTGGGVPGSVECKSYSQSKELAADSLAAYLMFATRKNAVFGDAADLVRLWELDAADQRASGENAFFGERVMSSHPSAVRRAALYLRLWASMLEEQDRYDSAIGLISANVEVDRGIAMLDSVRRALPGAPFVDEAMGAALLTQWLSTVPVDALSMRPTVGVVRTRFVEGLRGGSSAGDPTMLARARSALEAVKDVDNRPATLSNLALLDAFTGNPTRALERARRAVQLAQGDAAIRSTLGIAYFHAGRPDSARAIFGRILTDGASDNPTPAAYRTSCLTDKARTMSLRVCFNYARALYQTDKAAGTPLLVAYGDRYGQGPWGREAARLASGGTPSSSPSSGTVGSTAGTTTTTTTPTGTGTSRPTPTTPRPPAPGTGSGKIGNLGSFRALQLVSPDGLRRIATGMRPRDARSGVPMAVELPGTGNDGRVIQSEEAGVAFLVKPDPAGGERVVGIISSGSWALAGIKPGDPIRVLDRLGRVVDREDDTYVYAVTGHLVRVITDGTVVKSIVVRSDQ